MYKQIFRLAIPSIISNITVPLLGLADIAIMGHIGNAMYLAAIGVGTMAFNVIYWLMAFLRMSISGLASQAFGRTEQTECWKLFFQGLQIALTIGVLFVILQLPLRELSLWLMQTGDDIRPLVCQYFNICIYGAPAVLGCYILNGWLIGMQNTVIPMRVAILQNVLNILLSVTFVFVFRMQIAGVALGTLLSQWAAFLMLYFSAARKFGVSVRWSYFTRIRNVLVSPMNGIGGVLFLRMLCLVAVNLFFTSAGSRQGSLILAVNTLLMTFFTIFSYFMDGFASAAEALAGKFYGARESDNLLTLNRNMLAIGGLMVLFFTLLYYIGGDFFLSVLTDKQEVLSASQPYFLWAMAIPFCGVLAFIYDGIFIGLTRPKDMFHSCLLGALSFFLIYLLPLPISTNHHLWLALNTYLLFRSLYLAVVAKGFLHTKP